MSRQTANYQADQRLKEICRQANANSTDSPQTIQDRNSWFAKPTKKRILNASEVAKYLLRKK